MDHVVINDDKTKRIIRPGRTKRRIFRLVKVLVLLYSSIGIALFYLQEKFLLHPTALPIDHEWKFPVPYEELNVPYSKNENLNIIKFLTKTVPAKGAVIYFHGNMDNVSHYAPYTKLFTDQGYEVWMPDYPGFGKSTGELTEGKLYDQALQVYKMVNKKFERGSIVIYGRSFGTGIATYLASNVQARTLILETPYYSVPDIFSAYAPIYPTERMSTFKIPSWEYLSECKMPVVMFHGDDDEVIPYKRAVKLKAYLKTGDVFITIKDGRHNDLASKKEYIDKMIAVLK